MGNQSDNKSSTEGVSILGGFDSWTHLLRFILVFLVIIITLSLVSKNIVFNGSEIKIQFDDESHQVALQEIKLTNVGLQMLSKDNQFSYAQLTISSNQVWVDTGLDIEPGQKVSIKASGSVLLASHLLVKQYNEVDRLTNLSSWYWKMPNGKTTATNNLKPARPADSFRLQMLPFPGATNGHLIGVIVPFDGSEKPSVDYFQPELAWAVNEDAVYYTQPVKGRLYLTVNDYVMNFSDEQHKLWMLDGCKDCIANSYLSEGQYEGDELEAAIKNKQLDLAAQWNRAKRSGHRTVSFDDNIGAYSVVIYISTDETD